MANIQTKWRTNQQHTNEKKQGEEKNKFIKIKKKKEKSSVGYKIIFPTAFADYWSYVIIK